jgi:hypothetical protein
MMMRKLMSVHIYKVRFSHWNAKGSKKSKKSKKGKKTFLLFLPFLLFLLPSRLSL